jgi:hypothetical protein
MGGSMKLLKSITLFFIYPVMMLALGFLGGILFLNRFYPPIAQSDLAYKKMPEQELTTQTLVVQAQEDPQDADESTAPSDALEGINQEPSTEFMGVSSGEEKLSADTVYILEETDIRNRSVVETTWKIPPKYIGMTRQQFVEAMQEYEDSPPLSELERGFVGLEVVSFSRERVVVQMNYEYIQPTFSFYLKVEDHQVVVYLDDMETIYMDTDIILTELPPTIQQEIIDVKFIENEEALYDFLEMYSS